MPDDTPLRPRFSPGQSLAAADLEALVRHAADTAARHALAAHGPGLQQGLELLERPAAGGTVQPWLTPGAFVDGDGRQGLVMRPRRIEAAQLTGRESGLWQVLVGRIARDLADPVPGLAPCDPCQEGARIAEEVEVVIAGDLPLDMRQ